MGYTLKQDQLVLEQLQLETVGVMIQLGFLLITRPQSSSCSEQLGNGLRFGKKIPELAMTCLGTHRSEQRVPKKDVQRCAGSCVAGGVFVECVCDVGVLKFI